MTAQYSTTSRVSGVQVGSARGAVTGSALQGLKRPCLPHFFALATTGWSLAASMLLVICAASASANPSFPCCPEAPLPPSIPTTGLPLALMTRVMWWYRTCRQLTHASDLTRGHWR